MTRDRTIEPNLRNQTLKREQDRKNQNSIFPVQLTTSRISNVRILVDCDFFSWKCLRQNRPLKRQKLPRSSSREYVVVRLILWCAGVCLMETGGGARGWDMEMHSDPLLHSFGSLVHLGHSLGVNMLWSASPIFQNPWVYDSIRPL